MNNQRIHAVVLLCVCVIAGLKAFATIFEARQLVSQMIWMTFAAGFAGLSIAIVWSCRHEHCDHSSHRTQHRE